MYPAGWTSKLERKRHAGHSGRFSCCASSTVGASAARSLLWRDTTQAGLVVGECILVVLQGEFDTIKKPKAKLLNRNGHMSEHDGWWPSRRWRGSGDGDSKRWE